MRPQAQPHDLAPAALALPTRLLRLLEQGGLLASADLARALGVGEPLVALMLRDLAQRGYLAPVEVGCGVSCGGCGMAATCGAHTPLLVLTPKGRRAAATRVADGKSP